jgi:ABC-type nitrate/sulfonate/bicarbonate transport system ATPase subunit
MSPRPGQIAAEIDVSIPRPRRLDTLTSPAFMALKRRLLDLLYGQGAA